MCGIAGIIRFDRDARPELPRLIAMRDRLRHRGPDGEGAHSEDHCLLGHTRLALVDREGGAQPMRSPDGRYTLVYNGEIYNCAELRARLPWRFQTRSDAEVVLAAFAEWGPRAPRELDGMFAFFIWDALDESGFAARDRLGVKPFVFAHKNGELRFASEAKALVGARPRARLEPLLEVLVAPAFSGVERPLFEGLEVLPPGHQLRIDRDGLKMEQYCDYDLTADCEDENLAPRLREALARSVTRALEADAPVGIFLSGGLDSSLLAALARPANPPAFTIAFQDQDHYDYSRSLVVTSDDEPFARLAAAELGLNRELVTVDRSGLAADLAMLAAHNDALPAWEQELAQHHLARAAARRVKAVLVGDAADETHYGYHFLLDEVATSSPRHILERFAVPIVREDVLPRAVDFYDEKYRALARAAGHSWDTPRDRILATSWLIVKRWLPRLLHNGDIHGMAHSLEARVPFATNEVLALARTISPRLGLRNGVEKWLLREAARGLLPDAIRQRRKSALPKDQGTAQIYQREAAREIEFLSTILDGNRLRALCGAERLDERERALLFRVICMGHWARAHGVEW